MNMNTKIDRELFQQRFPARGFKLKLIPIAAHYICQMYRTYGRTI